MHDYLYMMYNKFVYLVIYATSRHRRDSIVKRRELINTRKVFFIFYFLIRTYKTYSYGIHDTNYNIVVHSCLIIIVID